MGGRRQENRESRKSIVLIVGGLLITQERDSSGGTSPEAREHLDNAVELRSGGLDLLLAGESSPQAGVERGGTRTGVA
jgi:hypothetical protein